MNENCQKWHEQIQALRDKLAEFRNTYQGALEYAANNHKSRDTAFKECRRLKDEIKPLIIKLKNDVTPSTRYLDLVNRLTFSPDATENKKLQEKMLEMVSEENYSEAVATAKELDPEVKVPTREKIIRNLLALGPEKLEKIGTIMGKPGLIIVPDKSMTEIKDSLNANPHYVNQDDTYFSTNFKRSGRTGKVSVSIVEMVQNPMVVPHQMPGKQRNEEQSRICEKYFRDNGMRHISDHQYAVAMQLSLRAYEKAKNKGEAKPEKYILDFCEHWTGSVTIINLNQETDIGKFAQGHFGSKSRTINFNRSNPDGNDDNLRGRGAMQIM